MFREYGVVRALIQERKSCDVSGLLVALRGLGITKLDIPIISHFVDIYKEELYERSTGNVVGDLDSKKFQSISDFVKSPFYG